MAQVQNVTVLHDEPICSTCTASIRDETNQSSGGYDHKVFQRVIGVCTQTMLLTAVSDHEAALQMSRCSLVCTASLDTVDTETEHVASDLLLRWPEY